MVKEKYLEYLFYLGHTCMVSAMLGLMYVTVRTYTEEHYVTAMALGIATVLVIRDYIQTIQEHRRVFKCLIETKEKQTKQESDY